MNLIIAGGGTGGHFFPGLALADAWKMHDPSVNITFVGTSRGLESRYIPKTAYSLELIETPPLKNKGIIALIKAFIAMPYALLKAYSLLKRLKASLVIGVGGYASGPVTLVAALTGIPTAVMEQNSFPGIANRILGVFVKKVFITFPDSARFFSKKKVILSGNPIRSKMKNIPFYMDVGNEKINVLCFGGSQGAMTINRGVVDSLRYLSDLKNNFYFVHQVGEREDIEKIEGIYRECGFEAEVLKFIDDMETRYAKADLVVCRAGATTLSELAVCGRAAVLVPFPFAADDHQTKNAKWIASQGAAIVIRDKDLTGELLARQIRGLMFDRKKLVRMADAMKKLARPDAADVIINESTKLI